MLETIAFIEVKKFPQSDCLNVSNSVKLHEALEGYGENDGPSILYAQLFEALNSSVVNFTGRKECYRAKIYMVRRNDEVLTNIIYYIKFKFIFFIRLWQW